MKLSEMSKTTKQNTEENKPKKNIQQSYDELKDCSSDELFKRLTKEVEMQKQNGTFDYEGLKNSIETIKAYLPNHAYQNMLRIIENLK